MKRLFSGLLVMLFICACCAPYSWGASKDSTKLTNRYSLLEELNGDGDSGTDIVVDTNINALTSVNRALNGATVRFSGEAVGDILAADDDHVWVNMLGERGTSIGVYMTKAQAGGIHTLGDYHNSGTVLEVEGIYSISCEEHEGELDVHASTVLVTDNGGAITHGFSAERLFLAAVLCLVGLVLLGTYLLLHRHASRKVTDD